jgi:hypothetical protein
MNNDTNFDHKGEILNIAYSLKLEDYEKNKEKFQEFEK